MLNYQRVTCWKFNFDLGFRMGIFHEDEWKLPVGVWQLAESSYPIGSMVLPYMVTFTTFTINIPQMLAYIPYMDPMGMENTGGLGKSPDWRSKKLGNSASLFWLIPRGDHLFWHGSPAGKNDRNSVYITLITLITLIDTDRYCIFLIKWPCSTAILFITRRYKKKWVNS